ncbi:MAG: nucleotidyltransferase domain-containing protein [Candidatus Aenigmatarchaeota archaeon]
MGGEKTRIIKGLKTFKEAIRKDYGVEKIVFFGSRATGTHNKHSDVDLILVSRKFKGKSLLKRPRGLHFYWTMKYPVDFICYTPEEFKKMRGKITIVRQALEEGVEV